MKLTQVSYCSNLFVGATVGNSHGSYFFIVVADLDAALDSAGSSIVVVDYSTTWCGPCKLVYPKFVELSDRLADVKFYKCVGDASKEASALMKREGVRSVPTFHIWKNKSKVDVVNGARIEEVEASIVSATKSTD